MEALFKQAVSIANSSLNNKKLHLFLFPSQANFLINKHVLLLNAFKCTFSKPASFVASLFVFCEHPKPFWVVLSFAVALKIFRMSCSRQCIFIN